MSSIRILAALAAACVANVGWTASPADPGAEKIPQAQIEREADDVLAAVVRVKAKAVAGARTSAMLGETREGSGVVIDGRGYVVTMGYIVVEADSIEITTRDDKTVPATLVGYDPASGFGLLKPGVPLGVRPMPMGQASDVSMREPVMILPAGGREAASLAYVVSKRKFTGSWEYLLESAIFTAPPTFQWAGAALVSREGKLVGIGSLLVRDALDEGTEVAGNMFVPIDLLKPILPELIEKGRRSEPARPWLGLATDELQGHLVVSRVSPEGPADRAGIKSGDIVVGVGGNAVQSREDLYRKVWALGAAGIEVPLRVLQGADLRELRLHSIDRFQYFRGKQTY